MPRWRALAPALVALLCLPAPRAPAQPDIETPGSLVTLPAPDDRDPDELRLAVRWGFNGTTLIAEAWAPVRFFVTSGAEARSGTLQVSYQQDGSQATRVSLPYATTPGRIVPIDATLAVPASVHSITVRLTDERGRGKKTYRFDRYADDTRFQLPTILSSPGAAFLVVGDTSLSRVASSLVLPTPPTPGASRSPEDPWAHALFTKATPADLTASRMAYDGYAAVIISAADLGGLQLDVREALKRWVRAGGTLILVASAPGDGWRLLFGADDAVRIAPARSVQTPEELTQLTETSPTLQGARPVVLSDRAARRGWTTAWLAPDGAALAAEGPLGFGRVVLLGVDPVHVVGVVSNDHIAPVWRSVLRPIIDRRADLAYARQTYYYGWDVSGASLRHKTAITAVIDGFLRVPSPGLGVFVLLTAFIVLLAVLVGPFDAIVLKKLGKRQLSWATALGYTALASALAALVPLTLRSNDTSYTRASIVDSLGPGLGADAERTAISSIYAGKPQSVSFEGVVAGAWWRPVSTRTLWGETTSATTFSTVQSSAAAPTGSVRQTVPPDTDNANPQRLWTLRTLMDQGPAIPVLASVEPDAEPGAYTATIRGLDGASDIRNLIVRFTDEQGAPAWAGTAAHSIDDGVLSVRWTAAPSLGLPPPEWRPADAERLANDPWRVHRAARPGRAKPSDLADLPGAWERTHAIERYLAAGCVLIAFECDRAEPDVALRSRADTRAVEVHRVVLTLPQEPQP